MHSRKRTSGFTIIELAIALAIAGILMAGAWAVVGDVWNSYRINALKENMFTLARNVQGHYQTKGVFFEVTEGNSINDELNVDTRRLVPMDMREDPTVDNGNLIHALGGAVTITSRDSGKQFRISYAGIEKEHCIGLLMSVPLLVRELGITRVATNTAGKNSTITIDNFTNPASNPLPTDLGTATAWCGGATNTVSYDFKIRP